MLFGTVVAQRFHRRRWIGCDGPASGMPDLPKRVPCVGTKKYGAGPFIEETNIIEASELMECKK